MVRLGPVCQLLMEDAFPWRSSELAVSEWQARAWELKLDGCVELSAEVGQAGSFAVLGCTDPSGCTAGSVDWDQDTVEEAE